MTPTGFYQSIEKRTLTVQKLEDISSALNVPVSYWWDDEPTTDESAVQDQTIQYGDNIMAEVRRLRKQIDDLVDDKDRLKKEIGELTKAKR